MLCYEALWKAVIVSLVLPSLGISPSLESPLFELKFLCFTRNSVIIHQSSCTQDVFSPCNTSHWPTTQLFLCCSCKHVNTGRKLLHAVVYQVTKHKPKTKFDFFGYWPNIKIFPITMSLF